MSEYDSSKKSSKAPEEGPPNLSRVERIIHRQNDMEKERYTYEEVWQECFDYIVPRKGEITTRETPGGKRGEELYDTTAIMANQLLAGALHSMLTNPALKFFGLTFGDPAIDDQPENKKWLEEVVDRMHHVLSQSNFQTEIHETYLDLGAIGQACSFMGEHPKRVIHFQARAMKEIFVRENALGLIDTVHRKYEWNARQIIDAFGFEKSPHEVKERFKKGESKPFTCIHVVEPNPKGPIDYRSYYVVKEAKEIVDEKYFHEFPYLTPRWTKTSGEIYGRGPGTEMLPDIKMVNAMMDTTIRGAEMTVFPPHAVEHDGVIGKVKLKPLGLTSVRMRNGQMPLMPLMKDARIDFGQAVVEDVRRRIRAGFYVDQLQLHIGPQMTATEVNQRTEEKFRLMGPVLGRQHFEFLRPMIERLFGIMSRRGMIPEAPQAIQDRDFDVRYTSYIARVQRMSQGQDIARAIQVAAPIMQAIPDSIKVIDGDNAVRHIFDLHDIPSKIFKDEEELAAERKAELEASQQIAAEEQARAESEVARNAAPAVAAVQSINEGP